MRVRGGRTGVPGAAGAADAVHVGFSRGGAVVVDHVRHALAARQVGVQSRVVVTVSRARVSTGRA